MPQRLYVLVYPSRLFAAHWSFWIPYLNVNGREAETGDRIHVTGDRINGFQYEYLRDYNGREDDRKPQAFAVGFLSDDALVNSHESGANSHNNTAGVVDGGDALIPFDRACRKVDAPGPSLNKVAPATDARSVAGRRRLLGRLR